MHAPSSSDARLDALRAEVRRIESAGRAGGGRLPFGLAAVDCRLTGGGLAVAALHEAALAARLAADAGGGTVLWTLSRRDLFAPGLASAGLTPDRLIYAECRRDEEVLAVMEDALRHGGLAAVVGEVGRLGPAPGRRLQLAAEQSGTTALMLRRWRRSDADPLGQPAAAVTRWRLACAPSAPLPLPGVGRARWRVELVRQRGGETHDWILEAPDAEARLALFARSADRPDQAVRTTA
jgi:protein ImuA